MRSWRPSGRRSSSVRSRSRRSSGAGAPRRKVGPVLEAVRMVRGHAWRPQRRDGVIDVGGCGYCLGGRGARATALNRASRLNGQVSPNTGDIVRRDGMDLLDRLLGHDTWTTRQILLRCREVESELHRPFDVGHETLHATLVYMIGNVRVWTDLMRGAPVERTGTNSRWPNCRNVTRPPQPISPRSHDGRGTATGGTNAGWTCWTTHRRRKPAAGRSPTCSPTICTTVASCSTCSPASACTTFPKATP